MGIFDFLQIPVDSANRELLDEKFYEIFNSGIEGRRQAFGAVSQPGGKDRRSQNALERIFQEVNQQFESEVGQEIVRGEDPNRRFIDTLSQFPLSKRLQAVTGSQTGDSRAFRPQTRNLFDF